MEANTLKQLTRAARDAADKGNWGRAAELWTSTLEDPEGNSDLEAHAGLAMAQLQLKNFKKAKAAAETGLALFPKAVRLKAAIARVAMANEDWATAEKIWRENMASEHPGNGMWDIGLFETLLMSGRGDEAQEVLKAARTKFPENPVVLNKLSLQATDARDWKALKELAIAGRELCEKLHKKVRQGTFEMYLARALFHLGEREEAARLMLHSSARFPSDNIDYRRLFIDVVSEARDVALISEACDTGFLSSNHTPYDGNVVFTLIQANQTAEAAKAFTSGFEARAAVPNYQDMIRHASMIFRGEEKASWYRKIYERATEQLEKFDSPMAHRRQRIKMHTARLEVLYGLEDAETFEKVAQEFHAEFPDLAAKHLDMAARLKDPANPKYSTNKIFGIGLSKTGTTSLTRALEIMGFSSAHYFNNYSRELLADRDTVLYDALTDTPISYKFEELYERYPDARFIYTTRPMDKWVPSLLKHLNRVLNMSAYSEFDEVVNGKNPTRHGELFRDVHNKLYVQYETPEDAYNAHDAAVRKFFGDRPEAKFLEVNFFKGDGFAELAAFLECDEPKQSFPWENVAAKKKPLALS